MYISSTGNLKPKLYWTPADYFKYILSRIEYISVDLKLCKMLT